MLNGRTKLHILNRGSVTGDSYCDEVLLPHVRLFRGAIGPYFIFMDANARPHRTLAVEELLESEGCLGETYCSTLTSSRENLTTQTDAGSGMSSPTARNVVQAGSEYA
ncbi:transposable element Tcb2 transposase [Trichonephila clavipes]|nr:transposable element Tcb2 transposase [Trichonephila clavipes]